MAKFKQGDRVRVRRGSPPGRFRTPTYIQGKVGRIDTVQGPYGNPETLAYGGDGLTKQFLYRVRFDQSHVWGGYAGPAMDQLLVDIYEHWLEPA